MQKIVSYSENETENIGKSIAKLLKGTETIALFGDLGAGKTAFVRGIASQLNSTEDVSSPTFAIVNEYYGKFKIYHFDMYRINSFEDLYSTGFFDYLNSGIVLIEWSENIENALPDDCIKIRISKTEKENERIFLIENFESEV